ncbi:MAG: hypothetical protein IJX87_04115 [Clostridia bacterium]|nr:hypothetical protein [Clostridia bacterium]
MLKEAGFTAYDASMFTNGVLDWMLFDEHWEEKSKEFRAYADGLAACSHHDDFKAHLELLPADVFVACVDIGHAEMAGLSTSAAQMIETLGDRVLALHVHDVDLVHDNHQVPFTQKLIS